MPHHGIGDSGERLGLWNWQDPDDREAELVERGQTELLLHPPRDCQGAPGPATSQRQPGNAMPGGALPSRHHRNLL